MKPNTILKQKNVAGLVTLALASSFLCTAQSAPAQSQTPSRFAGTWVENESKRKIGTDGGNLRFRRTPAGGLEEMRGPEVRPLTQPVSFGTAPYAIDAGKNTIAWKQNGATRFERQLFNSGQLINTRRIQIASDGKSLTEETEGTQTDRKKRTSTTVYRRTSGDGPGLAGVWHAESTHSDNPASLRYEVAGNALKFSNPAGVTYTLTLDGKPISVNGPAVISGTGLVPSNNLIVFSAPPLIE